MKTRKTDIPAMNERGIAIVAVLLLSLIALSITATLLYMVTQGTRSSGFFKRYQSARDAGVGGAEITVALIEKRGELDIPFLKAKDGLTDCVDFPNLCDCGDPDVIGDNLPNDCLCSKLCDPTADWIAGCDSSMDNMTSVYDIQCRLDAEGGKKYLVSTKVVDTIIGNSDLSGSGGLEGSGVVNAEGSKYFAPPLSPYLYRIEVDSRDASNEIEKSRWAVLYAF